MIRLNNTPQEGSTVKVNLGFRDSAGQYYIPTKIQYTLLALNNDKESWSVVDDIYQKSLTPASSVVLTIPNVQTIEGTTLQRKVMIYWDAFVDNEYNSFTDEITFDIAPKPFVPNPPSPQPEPQIFVEITNVSLQLGTIDNTPVQPVFLLTTNLPVRINSAMARVIDNEGHEFPCVLSVNTSGGNLTVSLENELNYEKSYKLRLVGLVSTIKGYEMREPFELSFVTCREDTPPYIPVIQDKKEVTITENGTSTIEPDTNYDGIKEVEVTVDIPLQTRKDVEVTENGRVEIRPDAEFTAMKKVWVNVAIPDSPILLYCYQGTIPFYFTKGITESGTYKAFTTDLVGAEYEVTVDGDITFEYLGNTETVTRDNTNDIYR